MPMHIPDPPTPSSLREEVHSPLIRSFLSLSLSLLPFTRVSISSPAHFLPELQISPPPPGDGVTYASGKKERISTALYVLFQFSSPPPKKSPRKGKIEELHSKLF